MTQNYNYHTNPLEEHLINQDQIKNSNNITSIISALVIGILIGASTMYLINSNFNSNLNSKKAK